MPHDLDCLLSKIGKRDVLEFSLGTSGRYYLKYRSDGKEKQSQAYIPSAPDVVRELIV